MRIVVQSYRASVLLLCYSPAKVFCFPVPSDFTKVGVPLVVRIPTRKEAVLLRGKLLDGLIGHLPEFIRLQNDNLTI